jgi:hypothetical protein
MHYQDDPFHPNNPNDLDDDDDYEYNYVVNDNESVTTRNSSVNTKKNRNQKQYEDIKNIDKGYNKISINVNGKKTSCELYSTSSTPGVLIRDAITGARLQGYRVGSTTEYLFFKVRYTGLGCKDNNIILFYDSPEHYERHMHTTIDSETKLKWLNKSLEIRKELNK